MEPMTSPSGVRACRGSRDGQALRHWHGVPPTTTIVPMDADIATTVAPGSADRGTGTLTPTEAASVLQDLGFLVVPGAPGRDSTGYLLVALRPEPTLAHFDPTSVIY